MRVLPTYSNGQVHYIEVSEKPSEFYDTIYRREKMYGLPACESLYYPLYKKVVARIDDNERVMDLGCGTGQFGQVLLLNGKKFVLGVDFSPIAVEIANVLMPFSKFMVADLYRSDTYHLVSYDCVTLIEVMEHLEYDLAVLGHIREGAHVIFTVPNYITEEGSHVRGFRWDSEIRDRYGKLMDIQDIEEIVVNRKENQKLWIVDGRR